MKKFKVQASLMLNDTLKTPLMKQTIEITRKEARDGGVYFACEKAAIEMDKRLTIIIDKERIKEIAS